MAGENTAAVLLTSQRQLLPFPPQALFELAQQLQRRLLRHTDGSCGVRGGGARARRAARRRERHGRLLRRPRRAVLRRGDGRAGSVSGRGREAVRAAAAAEVVVLVVLSF